MGPDINVASKSVGQPIAAIGISNTLRGMIAGWAKNAGRRGRTQRHHGEHAFAGPGCYLSRAGGRAAKHPGRKVAQRVARTVPVGRIVTPAEIKQLCDGGAAYSFEANRQQTGARREGDKPCSFETQRRTRCRTSNVVPATSLMKANFATPISVGSTMNSTP